MPPCDGGTGAELHARGERGIRLEQRGRKDDIADEVGHTLDTGGERLKGEDN